MFYYRIAGLCVAIEEVAGIPPMVNFAPFRTEPATPDLTYRVRPFRADRSPAPPPETMTLVSRDLVNSLYLSPDAIWKCVAMQAGDPRVMWFHQKIGDWDEATVYIPEDWLDFVGFGNALSFEKTLLPHHALMLHCALIEWEGLGIAFSAPSQTGKSTQAGLWEKHRGASVLNGDRAILRVEGGTVYAYGSPYAGSSDLFIPRRVPLTAIVMLSQAKENTVRDVPQEEALGLFLSQTSLTLWEPTLFEFGMNTMETILTRVPMGALACLPDESAVRCLEGWLKP